MTTGLVPWWEALPLRGEIVGAGGNVDDVQMSLFAVAHDVGAERPPYADARYYGEITHPSGQFAELMANVAVRLGGGAAYRSVPALWRLDQGMGGGKSHGLIGLYHLAANPLAMAATDVGREALATAAQIAGRPIAGDLGDPRLVVLSADHMTAGRGDSDRDGPAVTLHERFLWRLFDEQIEPWRSYRQDIGNKARLEEALRSVGRPVLILVDEIMDYVRQLSLSDRQDLAVQDMAFLRALLDVANDVPHVAMVMVMIASEHDAMDLDTAGQSRRAELEQLLIRNGKTATINDAGDFAAILRRRLFEPAVEADSNAAATATAFATHMQRRAWRAKVFDHLSAPWASRWEEEVGRCYPFHPQLIALAEQEWAKLAGFQRVRSTIRIFAATAFALAERGRLGAWAPLLIGPGDLPLSDEKVREAIIGSGLIVDEKTQANYRQLALTDIVSSNEQGGAARSLDLAAVRDPGRQANPRAAERAATLIFLTSIVGSRGGGRQGATGAEAQAAMFVPDASFAIADADGVLEQLKDADGGGLASLEEIPGRGGQPQRLFLSTRQTLNMLVRAARGAVTDQERDREIGRVATRLMTTGPFHRKQFLEADTQRRARDVLAAASFDDARLNRLVVLDPEQFILQNGADRETREAVRAAMGLGDEAIPVTWAPSAVFALANVRGRQYARAMAVKYLAWCRVAEMADVASDPEQRANAEDERAEARTALDRAVKRAFQHVMYVDVADDGESRTDRMIDFDPDRQSSLDGMMVWEALAEKGRSVSKGTFSGKALIHNLREIDYARPLDEVRNLFWNTPRMPMLPDGDRDIQKAIFEAVQSYDVQVVGADGAVREVTRSEDIAFLPGMRLTRVGGARPGSNDDGEEGAGDGGMAGGTGDPPLPPHEGRREREVTFSLMINLRDEAKRGQAFKLLRRLTDSIDNDGTTYAEVQMKMRMSEEDASEVAQAAREAGANPNVREV